jgi:5-methylcytosine-specific restriction endonuclease McrA
MRYEGQDAFYKSHTWYKVRDAYKAKARGLCERCLKNGKIVPGEIVHHKIHLNSETVHDPNLALNFDNLELLCRDCHAEEHSKYKKRYRVDEYGRAIVKS